MKFNDSTNTHDSLAHYVLFLLGNITTTDYPLADMARATNTAKYNLAVKTFKNQDSWDFDDTANSSFPIATTSLVNSQADYPLPSDALNVRRIEVKDSGGNWSRVDKVDETNIGVALDEFRKTDGIPEYYRIESGSLILYPAPDTNSVTATAGLKITYDRSINEFSSSTTTTEVGMGEIGDRVVAHEVAEEWAGVFRPDRLEVLRTRRTELENEHLGHVSHRAKDEQGTLKVPFDDSE